MKTIFLPVLLLAGYGLWAQTNVQQLQPAHLSIFKNGTYFIKKEATVNIENGSFIIPAPSNVLMGTYWLAAGKAATLKSITVKADTFRMERNAVSLSDYLKANINQQVTLTRDGSLREAENITGTLLAYDESLDVAKIRTPEKRIIVLKTDDLRRVSFNETALTKYKNDSIAQLAKVMVTGQGQTIASTLSLEKGMQWYASYLMRIVNDKEARLEMKATIVNGDEDFINVPVDIIIGNPEMFYGKQLDPICVDYLNAEIFKSDNYQYNFANVQALSSNSAYATYDRIDNEETGEPDKDGEKLEDLFFYQLGRLNLEKNSRVIVPVLTMPVTYEDIYTVDLGETSASADKEVVQDVHHKYRVKNTGTAPFTTGSVLVINNTEMPMAQSQLKYTPVQGSAEINLSKAIDVQAKNEELEVKRDAKVRTVGSYDYYDLVSYNGKIKLSNYQDKKIIIKVTKTILGSATMANTNGKMKKVKDQRGSVNPTSVIEWEISLDPNEQKELSYSYTAYEK